MKLLELARDRHESRVRVLRIEYIAAHRRLVDAGVPQSDAHDEMLRRATSGLTFDTQRPVRSGTDVLARVAVATVQREA